MNPDLQSRQDEIVRRVRDAEPNGSIANVRIGPARTDPAAPAHTRGVREGNRVRKAERVRGMHEQDPLFAVATAERSTGINPERHNPIDPDSPNLPPP